MSADRGEDATERPDEDALSRFTRLARKLVQVPKREIDAEQAKEDERKKDDGRPDQSLPVRPA